MIQTVHLAEEQDDQPWYWVSTCAKNASHIRRIARKAKFAGKTSIKIMV